MIPGPNYVYECPNCGNILTRGSLASGNTFRAKVFSDGKRIAPMLPEFADLTKCKKCNNIFWLSKLKEIGKFECGDHKNPKWETADNADFLEIDDYFRALETGAAETQNEEFFIRQELWWAFNDRTRAGKKMFNDEDEEMRWKENLKNLLNLLDQSDIYQKIMVAEISRNLGDFKSCISIIEGIDNDELNWFKEHLLYQCKQKNKLVVELN